MSEKALSRLKTVLIVLLFCTAVLLTAATISRTIHATLPIDALAGLLGLNRQDPEYIERETSHQEAAYPIAVSLTGENGRGSTLGDPTQTAALYEQLRRPLGIALASCESARELTRERWTALFSGRSATLLYNGTLPVSALAYWLGAKPAQALAGLSAQAVTLALDESDQVCLLLYSDDRWLHCATSLRSAELRTLLDSCRPDSSVFALECESRLAPFSLLTTNTIVPEVTMENLFANSDRINAAATVLGLNPYRDTAYTSPSGTVSLSSGSGQMRITTGGELTYLPSGTVPVQAPSSDEADLIELARALLAQLAAPGDGQLMLTSVRRNGLDTILEFDYTLAGYPVRLPTCAATVQFDGLQLVELRLLARTFTLTGGTRTLLPAQQATAIVADGTWLIPIYADSGGFGCNWPNN